MTPDADRLLEVEGADLGDPGTSARRRFSFAPSFHEWGAPRLHEMILPETARTDSDEQGASLGIYLRSGQAGLRGRIRAALRSIERFPVSYNRTLLAGSLDYCRCALVNAESDQIDILRAIGDYVNIAIGAVEPYLHSVPSQWARLDFTLLYDRFENLQITCSEKGVLPRLEDVTVEDVVRSQG